MNRVLTWLNLLGVLALTGLCVFQWRANRALNLQVNDLDTIRIAHSAKIAEQARTLRGLQSDLDRFRDQLAATSLSLKNTGDKLRSSEALAAQLTAECDQLKASIAQWTAAVAARDDRLKEANARITDLASRLHDAVSHYNTLVASHNALVKQVNAERAGDKTPASPRGGDKPPAPASDSTP